MSLATRCSSCNTVFRVVQDQLRVSDGWVRCGRCHAVFNALESLFDLVPAPAAPDPSVPPDAPGAPAAPTTEAAVAEPRAAAGPATPPEAADQGAAAAGHLPTPAEPPAAPADAAPAGGLGSTAEFAAEPSAEAAAQGDSPASSADSAALIEPPAAQAAAEPAWLASPSTAPATEDTPASRVDAQDRNEFADARFNTALLAEAGIAATDSVLDAVPASEPPADAAPPEFLRRSGRESRWSRPRARIALALAALLLVVLLALQVVLHYRDLVATLLPESRPALEALCGAAGCTIEPLRRIDDIVIESSSLNALPGGDAVRLSLVLRNRGPFNLAQPAIELTLTDSGGQMIARRILEPADFGAAPVLPAASELPLQIVLSTSGRRASGYTVEPFYL